MYRLDVSGKSGGLLVYIKSTIPSKILTDFDHLKKIQALAFEIHLNKKKWLVVSIYNPNKILGNDFLSNLTDLIDFYGRRFEHCILIGDFNMQIKDLPLSVFLVEQDLQDLVKNKTCYKCISGTAIDLILTDQKNSFQHTNVLETGLSDHHLMVYTMFKSTFSREPARNKTYRCYKRFNKKEFLNSLNNKLHTNTISEYSCFEKVFKSVLDEYASRKNKKDKRQ